MDVSDDLDLLRRYVEHGSDAAFGALVARHVDMVYAVAKRQLGPGGQADEVTQAVFILLMRKADRLPPGTVVAGWLYRTAKYAAANAKRADARRRKHERRAADMAAATKPDGQTWAHVAPHLDEAIAKLPPGDRSAVVLRFLERRSMAEVGRSLGVSEHAAQMRVSRALDKLRHFFGRRGVTLPAAALGVLILSHAAEPAPAALTRSITHSALAGQPAAGARSLADQIARREVMARTARVGGLVMAGVCGLCLMTCAARITLDRLPAVRPPAVADGVDRFATHGVTVSPFVTRFPAKAVADGTAGPADAASR